MQALCAEQPPITLAPSERPSSPPDPQSCVKVNERGSSRSAGQRARCPRPVVGPRLDQADTPLRVLGQACRDDAPRGAAAHDRDVERHGRSIRLPARPTGLGRPLRRRARRAAESVRSPVAPRLPARATLAGWIPSPRSHRARGPGSSAPSPARHRRRSSPGRRSRRAGTSSSRRRPARGRPSRPFSSASTG